MQNTTASNFSMQGVSTASTSGSRNSSIQLGQQLRALKPSNNTDRFKRLENLDCINAYGINYVSNYRSVLVVIANQNSSSLSRQRRLTIVPALESRHSVHGLMQISDKVSQISERNVPAISAVTLLQVRSARCSMLGAHPSPFMI